MDFKNYMKESTAPGTTTNVISSSGEDPDALVGVYQGGTMARRKKNDKKMDEGCGCDHDSTDPDDNFAGCPVFKVSSDTFLKFKEGKKSRYHRWNRYLNMDEEPCQRMYNYAKNNPGKSMIVKNSADGSMMYAHPVKGLTEARGHAHRHMPEYVADYALHLENDRAFHDKVRYPLYKIWWNRAVEGRYDRMKAIKEAEKAIEKQIEKVDMRKMRNYWLYDPQGKEEYQQLYDHLQLLAADIVDYFELEANFGNWDPEYDSSMPYLRNRGKSTKGLFESKGNASKFFHPDTEYFVDNEIKDDNWFFRDVISPLTKKWWNLAVENRYDRRKAIKEIAPFIIKQLDDYIKRQTQAARKLYMFSDTSRYRKSNNDIEQKRKNIIADIDLISADIVDEFEQLSNKGHFDSDVNISKLRNRGKSTKGMFN